MTWTDDQEQLWQLCRADQPPVPSGDQSPEQAFHMAVSGFERVCDFEGVQPPSREAIERRMTAEHGPPTTLHPDPLPPVPHRARPR